MAFRTRLRRLLDAFPDARWCACRTDPVVVRYRDDLAPPDDDGVCGICGLPRPTGPSTLVVVNMPCRRAEACAP